MPVPVVEVVKSVVVKVSGFVFVVFVGILCDVSSA